MRKTISIAIPIILLLSCSGTRKTDNSINSINFTLEQLGGGKVSLAEQKGKVVLVDFWATWCGPCRAAIPNLVSMYNTYKDQGLVVLGISLDQEKDALPKFVKEYSINYPILYGDQQVTKAFEIQSIPTLVIFDKKGKIAFREVGFSDENIATLEQKIKDVLTQ
jgi:thiol-disulfide isomerase/thioredoxin